MLDPESRVKPRRIEDQFLYLIYRREARAGGQFVLERLDMLRRAFGDDLDPAVLEVLHITRDLMPRGGALSEKTIAHALHLAANQKLTRN